MDIELCPYCNTEVELLPELRPQKCSECGRTILPCGHCIDIYGDCIKPCPLDIQMRMRQATTFFPFSRNLTKEEVEGIKRMYRKLSTPTGRKIFDFLEDK